MTMDQLQLEHRERVTHACTLAIQHAGLLCSEPAREFAELMTSMEALERPASSLGKIRYRKRGLSGADLSLILAVEELYSLHASKGWCPGREYRNLLTLCWNGVGEALDRENHAKGQHLSVNDSGSGPLQVVEQTFQREVVLPLIQESFEVVRVAEKELKKEVSGKSV